MSEKYLFLKKTKSIKVERPPRWVVNSLLNYSMALQRVVPSVFPFFLFDNN
jgi:hypothetical protein